MATILGPVTLPSMLARLGGMGGPTTVPAGPLSPACTCANDTGVGLLGRTTGGVAETVMPEPDAATGIIGREAAAEGVGRGACGVSVTEEADVVVAPVLVGDVSADDSRGELACKKDRSFFFSQSIA